MDFAAVAVCSYLKFLSQNKNAHLQLIITRIFNNFFFSFFCCIFYLFCMHSAHTHMHILRHFYIFRCFAVVCVRVIIYCTERERERERDMKIITINIVVVFVVVAYIV